MDGIAPIRMANLTTPAAPAIDTSYNSFSTSGSSGDNFLNDMMSESLAERAQQEKSVTVAMTNLRENPRDLAASLDVQDAVTKLSISKNLEISLAAKLKNTIEKLVISPSS